VKFLLDHDVPDDVTFSLVALNHIVVKLREVIPTTTSDDAVLRLAGERSCVLITCNRDDFLAAATHRASRHHNTHPPQVSGIGTRGVGPPLGFRRGIGVDRQHQLRMSRLSKLVERHYGIGGNKNCPCP
jgi:hypothetical protein